MDSSEMICEFHKQNVRLDSQRFLKSWSRIEESSSLIIEKPLKLGDWRYLMNILAEVNVSRIEHLVLELPYEQEAPLWVKSEETVAMQTELELARVFRTGRFSALKTLRIMSSQSGQVSGLGQGQSAFLAAALKKGKFTNLLTLSLPACDVLPILEALTEGGISQLISFSIISGRGLASLRKSYGNVMEALDTVLESGSFKNLRTLSLFNGVLENSACWKIFTRAMGSGLMPNIKDLSLSGSPMFGFDLADLVWGHSNPFSSLENLGLDSCQITSQQLCTMVDAVKRVSHETELALKCLYLQDNRLENDAVHALVKLADTGCLRQLQTLDINSVSAMYPRDVLPLLETIESGTLPNLQSLKWNIKLDDEEAQAIARAYFESKAMTVELDFDWSDVSDRSLSTKVKSYRERNLRIATLKDELEDQLEEDLEENIRGVTPLTRAEVLEEYIGEVKPLTRAKVLEGYIGEVTPLTRAKVFLCGYPEVGKSKLRKILVRQLGLRTRFKWETRPNLFKEPRTRGIELSRVAQKNHHGDQTELVLWDLAGQEEYHVLHGTFIADLGLEGGKATTFVLVFKALFRAEVKEELLYWFQFVASSSVRFVRRHVVIVLNCFDGKQCTETDQLKWIALIKSSASDFDDLLDICLDPFIMDVRVTRYVQPLKEHLFDHAQALLRDVKVPRVCFKLQEELKGWSASTNSKHLPIFSWEAYENSSRLKHKVTLKALKIAASYLHEIGEIIYFKEKDLIEPLGSGRRGVVVPDPQWFCKEVVGQLLLPKELLEGKSSLEVHADGSISIKMFRNFFEHLLIDGTNSDDVIAMLEQVGLCYRKGSDEIIVPALICKDDYNSLHWEGQGFHGVMGRCFAAADKERFVIPVTLFRRLQVELAQNVILGGSSDSDYRAGKSFSYLRVGQLLILIQFDVDQSNPTDDRIDILVRNMLQGDPREVRLTQIKCICEMMQKLEDLCASCCPGIKYETKIIKPWSASEKTPRMVERRLMSLREMEDLLIKGRQYSSWLLNGNPVELQSFFSENELKDILKKQATVLAGQSKNRRSGVPPRVDEVTENPNISSEITEESEDQDTSVKVTAERENHKYQGVEMTRVLMPLSDLQGLMMNGETHTSWDLVKNKPSELKIVLSDGQLKALQDRIVASKEIAESEYGELMRFVRSAGLLGEDFSKSLQESVKENSSKAVRLVPERAAFEKQTNDYHGFDEEVISAKEKQGEGEVLQVDGVTEDPHVVFEVGEPSERPDVSLEITSEQGLAKMMQQCRFDEVVISAKEKQGEELQVDGVTEDANVILEVGEPSERPDDLLQITSEQGLPKMMQEFIQLIIQSIRQPIIDAVFREGLSTRQTVRQDGHRTRQFVGKTGEQILKQILVVQSRQAFFLEEKESSVPRYMYLTRKDNSRMWISLKEAFQSSFRLHLLCEAHFNDGILHEVEGQEGIKLRRPKKWLMKVSPWLRRSLQVAIMVGKTVGNIYVPGVFNVIPNYNYLQSDVEELARAVDRAATMLEDEDEVPIQIQDDHQEQGTATYQHIDLKERMIAEQVVAELRKDLGGDVFAKRIGLKRVLLIETVQPEEGSSKQAEPSVLWICHECYKQYKACPAEYKIRDISPSG